jgi:hypothetical protein
MILPTMILPRSLCPLCLPRFRFFQASSSLPIAFVVSTHSSVVAGEVFGHQIAESPKPRQAAVVALAVPFAVRAALAHALVNNLSDLRNQASLGGVCHTTGGIAIHRAMAQRHKARRTASGTQGKRQCGDQ